MGKCFLGRFTAAAVTAALLLLMTSCNNKAPLSGYFVSNIINNGNPVRASAAELDAKNLKDQEKEPYTLYTLKNDYRLSMYEPTEGCYLSANITGDKLIEGRIEQFEELTGKKHTMYSYSYKMGEQFPVSFVLGAISKIKTPFIELLPENDNLYIDNGLIDSTARAFGKFSIPMFIQLCPVDKSYDTEAYKKYYTAVRQKFREFAPKCTFVFSVSNDYAFRAMKYYPGDEYVDWVGIDVFRKINDAGVYDGETFSDIDYVYYTFQSKKPIMLSKLGISSYSSRDYKYKPSLATSELERLYGTIINYYPRIKAINYMDYTELTETSLPNLPGRGGVLQSYCITDSEGVLEAYKKAVESSLFLPSLDVKSKGDLNSQWLRSPFMAYKIDNDYYISEKSAEYDIGIFAAGTKSYSRYSKTIEDSNYLNIKIISTGKLAKSAVNDTDKKIYATKGGFF